MATSAFSTTSASSDTTQTAVNIVFGLTATAIGGVTIWQGYKSWKTWHGHGSDDGAEAHGSSLESLSSASGADHHAGPQSDVELGLPSRTSTASSQSTAPTLHAGESPSPHPNHDAGVRDRAFDGGARLEDISDIEDGMVNASGQAAGNRT